MEGEENMDMEKSINNSYTAQLALRIKASTNFLIMISIPLNIFFIFLTINPKGHILQIWAYLCIIILLYYLYIIYIYLLYWTNLDFYGKAS